MDSFIETFHIDWKIIIAQAINFVIVLFILYFLVVKPLKTLMKERSIDIEGGLNAAKENALLLTNTKKEYDAIIAKARIEANEIFQEGKKDSEAKRAEMMEKTKGEVEGMISSGKKVLESEKAKIIEEAKGEIVSLVVKATEKLLESHPDENFEKNTISQIKKM